MGNNRQPCFFEKEDYQTYLKWLDGYAHLTRCNVHAYVLMENHVHLLITPETDASLGSLMKHLGQRYVQYVNRKYHRSGTLWEGRFRSGIIQEGRYLIACYRYIESNPVRSGLRQRPDEYPWSSFSTNALGNKQQLITPHPSYVALAHDDASRAAAYRRLFKHALEPNVIQEIQSATSGNYAFGNNRFKKEIAVAIGQPVCPGKPGRPKKPDVQGSDTSLNIGELSTA